MRLGALFAYHPRPDLLSTEAIADPPAYNLARAIARYDDVASTLVHGLKYSDRLDLSPMMGRLMAHAGCELLADADAPVPVPLHWRPHNIGDLRRPCHAWRAQTIRATPQQVGRSRTERADNVQGAFLVPA
jgi:predicted amidophosphoribosyltransferase